MKKLGIERPKLYELSGLKRSVFDKLTTSMIALRQQQETEKPSSKTAGKKRPATFIEGVEAKPKQMEEEQKKKESESAEQQVDFATWKRRMLEEAQSKN